MLASLALHLALTALPAVAAALLAARLGVRAVPVLLGIALAATGALALLAFWAYYGDRTLGESCSYLIVFGSVLAIAWSLYGGHLEGALLRQLAIPLALWMLGTVFLVYLGFVHGGSDQPLAVSSLRFSHQLPSDNAIPQFYADWFFGHGHRGTPPVFPGEWLSSDRPPLQIGYVLAQRPFGWDDTGLHYQLLGVALQQLWIVGLWALLLAARVGRVTRALAAVTVLLSAVAIVNGFYVWPKLLPVAMLLAAAALVLTPIWSELRRSPWAAGLFALLCGLAMMGHGASVFGVIPLVAVAAIRGLPGWRWVGVALLVAVAVMAPWSAYQKYGDPPGNRLTKWTLAGFEEIDDRGTLQTVVDSYREAGVVEALRYKVDNAAMMAGSETALESAEKIADGFGDGHPGTAAREIRAPFFFNLVPSFGLLLVAALTIAVGALAGRGRRREHPLEWSFALICFAALGGGALAWGLLAFGNYAARTSLHVGSFLLPILGLCACVAGLRALFPRFAVYFLCLNAALMLALFAPALEPLPGTAYSPLPIAIAAAALAGFVVTALEVRLARR
jgi:hypothetical protein